MWDDVAMFHRALDDVLSSNVRQTLDGGSELMTKAQKLWVNTMRKQSQSNPEKADHYPEVPPARHCTLYPPMMGS